MKALSTLLFIGALLAPTVVAAQLAPFEVPLAGSAPAVAGDVLRVIVVGAPDPRIERLSARRLSSRQRGEERAREAIHAFVDDVLADERASAMTAAAVHALVDDQGAVVGRRPLAAGETVIVFEIPVAALSAAAPIPGAPWSR